ncbi:MAG: hypothetical protein Q4E75_06325, partial [bacterium]|nr:hypothetical protein [bacterium]
NKIDKVDSFYSSDENQIKYLEEINNIILDNNNKTYGGYEYSVDVTKTSLIIKTNINIKNLNKNNLIKNNIIEEDYVIGDNITLNGIINYYKSKGAKCDI